MKERKSSLFPKRVIIAPTDPIYAAVRRAGKCTGRDKRIDLFRYALLPICGNQVAVAGPALGAPAAALLMERLVREGVKEVLLFSVCGALVPALRIGDLFLPTGGISEEGTSRLYWKGPIPALSQRLLKKIRAVCRQEEPPLQEGMIWTTDAPARETLEKITRYKEEGALAVDMEFTALATVTDYYNVEFTALMVVSDEAWKDPPRVGFRKGKFRKGLQDGAHLAVGVMAF